MGERELPGGWEWKRLGDIGKILSGSTPSTTNPEYFDGEIPWITPADLSNFNGTYIERGKKNITEIGLKSSSAQLLPKDTILFSSRAPIGYVAIAANPITTNQGFKNLVLKEGIDPKYVFYYLKTHKREMQQFGSGSTFLEISAARFAKIPIIIPPLPVQRHIVAVLEQAEAVKRQRQEADALTGALLQSVFFEMFGDPVRNEKGWKKQEFKKFGEIKTGNTPPRINPDNYGDFIEWIKSDNINTDSVYLAKSQEYLSEEGLRIGRFAPKNSILITCIAGSLSCIGNAAIADRDVSFNQQINAILPNSDVSELFLYYAILLSQEYIQNHATKSMTKMINKGDLSELLFICPPLALQQQFARVVQDVERIREQQAASGKEIEGLCEGLMQRAFAGELSV